MKEDVLQLLLTTSEQYQTPSFIQSDPISIPHRFKEKQDIEITAFWLSILSWGNRKSIINSGNKLLTLMGNSPYDFIKNHKEKNRAPFLDFKHRTFQPTDTLYFLEFLQWFYNHYSDSLENAFVSEKEYQKKNVKEALIHFQEFFFHLENAPKRTRKHVSSPIKNSSCKRLNMFLRWMVRSSDGGVDFGIWNKIKPAQLIIPLDVHVQRTATKLGLIQAKKSDWKTAVCLTETLKQIKPNDPCFFDYGLFGLGLENRKSIGFIN